MIRLHIRSDISVRRLVLTPLSIKLDMNDPFDDIIVHTHVIELFEREFKFVHADEESRGENLDEENNAVQAEHHCLVGAYKWKGSPHCCQEEMLTSCSSSGSKIG